MPPDFQNPRAHVPPPYGGERRTAPKSTARGLLPRVAAIAVVLALAAGGGLATAWIVANMRAVPPPVGGVPTPRTSAGQSFTPAPSDGLPTAQPSDPPRRTPTPSPVVTVEPTPFVHIVERGETLSEIAAIYQVAVEDIVSLNSIRNQNRIQIGQELLIPGYGTIPTPRPRN